MNKPNYVNPECMQCDKDLTWCLKCDNYDREPDFCDTAEMCDGDCDCAGDCGCDGDCGCTEEQGFVESCADKTESEETEDAKFQRKVRLLLLKKAMEKIERRKRIKAAMAFAGGVVAVTGTLIGFAKVKQSIDKT